MNKIIVTAMIIIAGWYGSFLYRQGELTVIREFANGFGSNEQVKCITKDGRVLYGDIPQGTVCEKVEPIEGSLTVQKFSILKRDDHKASGFRCDGRQYCSQMKSRAEAEFFARNCPNTKMDGDHDGVPCENDSRF
ncbi:excalibur calcium-binding domain-containing protein [Nitrosococcus watsonii]|uniref:Excalibur domain protein n=1 Tax=Nitrosococcus watsoni (strain C-113) TaxID=105559 RepID=D8KAQ5_NITWC|nr:excalibur calcium-binding domain-containing protein [Nitrosococcus watsonii]ADJ29482.1 Excalibur domain protein [Nitrosococcus watsonii C-113]